MEDQKLDEHEENFIDPGEEDDDYDPDDEDSIGSEEEATSGFSDEEYTPTTTTTTPTTTSTTTIQSWRKPATGQLLRQGGELSEYEKIREDNIREKEQLLRSLQGDWQEFKESEGLVVGGSQSGAKKVLKVLDRDPVKTRTRTSSLPAVGSGAQGDQRQPHRVPGEVGERKIVKKVPRGVLVKCEQCGEEMRGKILLKEHIKFYHPKIKAQKPSRKAGKGSKSSYGFQTANDWV